jgi:hypothetical protein
VVPDYFYELRRGDAVEATGRMSRDDPLEVGDTLAIGGLCGVVRAIYPQLAEHAMRVVVQLTQEDR